MKPAHEWLILTLCQLREYLRHVGVQLRAADLWVGFVQRHTPAEQDARPIGRSAVVVDDLLGVADDAVLRHQLVDQARRQRLGRDHVAADRDHAALQPRREIAGIAVGGDDDVAGFDHAFRHRNAEAGTGPLNCGCRAVRDDLDAGLAGHIKQAAMIAGRIDRSVRAVDDAAVVEIGAQFAALLGTRHHRGVDFETLRLMRDFLRQRLVLHWTMRGVEAADHVEGAVDILVGDEALDEGQRVVPLLHNAERAIAAVLRRKVLEAWLDAGRDLPAVARAAAEAGRVRVDYHGMPSAPCGLDAGVKSRITRTDDDHVGFRRQPGIRRRHARNDVPPIRGELAVGGKQINRHVACSRVPMQFLPQTLARPLEMMQQRGGQLHQLLRMRVALWTLAADCR